MFIAEVKVTNEDEAWDSVGDIGRGDDRDNKLMRGGDIAHIFKGFCGELHVKLGAFVVEGSLEGSVLQKVDTSVMDDTCHQGIDLCCFADPLGSGKVEMPQMIDRTYINLTFFEKVSIRYHALKICIDTRRPEVELLVERPFPQDCVEHGGNVYCSPSPKSFYPPSVVLTSFKRKDSLKENTII